MTEYERRTLQIKESENALNQYEFTLLLMSEMGKFGMISAKEYAACLGKIADQLNIPHGAFHEKSERED